ncbi:MAG: hypothetical protein U1D06_12890, partial [Paracoccaceae bacterium]|nr:hypothetical protein [Paracoccaceae bacterium]
IRARGRHVFEAGLLDQVDLAGVTRFADLGGNAQALALAAFGKWGCDIDLIDLDPKGRFAAGPSEWVAACRAFLLAGGVPPEKLRIVQAAADLRAVDVLANLSGFGDVSKARAMEPVLEACLRPGARMITDIRRGSGAFPYLRRWGACSPLSVRNDGGGEIARVLLRVTAAGGTAAPAPNPAATAKPAKLAKPADKPKPTAKTAARNEDTWAGIAGELAGTDGFTRANDSHSFLHIPRGDTLVVTFDNLDIAMTKREDRRPWGFSFIEKQGWSMLGVMANGWTWYRDPWVCDQFDDLAASGFFARYKRVVFYGASMGGYAACAFVPACPGADVVAISPQATLDKSVVPWETRYKTAWGCDFRGKYGDASQVSRAAGRVTLLYDPYEPLDAGHADLFTQANVLKLRTPLLGHRLGSSLQQMGILAPITLGALNGTLTELEFYRTLRARKGFARYQKELFKRAVERGHPDLARALGRGVQTRGDNRFIRKELAGL